MVAFGSCLLFSVALLSPCFAQSTAIVSDLLIAKKMSEAELDQYGELDAAVRKVDEALVFHLLNLTGIEFRLRFCKGQQVAGSQILAKILEEKDLSNAHRGLFKRWHAAKLQFGGHSVAVWREIGAEDVMRSIECTGEKLADSRAWLSKYGK
jgi:hypothetical protein